MNTAGIVIAIVVIGPTALDTSDLYKVIAINYIIITKETSKQASFAFGRILHMTNCGATIHHGQGLVIGGRAVNALFLFLVAHELDS